jgi:hypothetical protein
MANKEYISVLFEEKDDAKSLGAKWDGEKKLWYIPENINEINKLKLQEKYKTNNKPILELIGEDRTFGGNELFVDLIPRSCWFSNVRTCIRASDWDKVRKYVFERVNYTCECCSINTKKNIINGNLEAHERWEYDNLTKAQKLKRIIALCHQCHQTTHIGLAEIKGKKEEAMKHLQTIRNFTEEECKEHIDNAFKIWNDRCKFEWSLDISLIEKNNIKLSNKVDKMERLNICKEQLKVKELTINPIPTEYLVDIREVKLLEKKPGESILDCGCVLVLWDDDWGRSGQYIKQYCNNCIQLKEHEKLQYENKYTELTILYKNLNTIDLFNEIINLQKVKIMNDIKRICCTMNHHIINCPACEKNIQYINFTRHINSKEHIKKLPK